ncbi:A-kinase anchor protein 13-like isoform X2 [Acipenser ruthenus]|uniref:A-kinase anchor protein 13-like isoform X2 n=1 Tax=Acipenser ruthenus TaxID=7906 RepID=UPI002741D711|nr:A-kinase anchor protein 13-like isoform X2 [Acipenser ruthenus]
MKLNPQQAPLYGECLLTVQLCDEDHFEDEDGLEFYLLFAGTAQRHLTSTHRVNPDTLQAICPAHDCCEEVTITLCSSTPGRPVGCVAEQGFRFVQDVAFDVAQFLVSSAGCTDALDRARLLEEFQIPAEERERLDDSVALALRHLPLPEGWSVLGPEGGAHHALPPRETLLHFTARRGLHRLAWFFLQQPGGRAALSLPNTEGATPGSLAHDRGYSQLQQLFSQEEGADPEPWVDVSRTIFSGDCLVKHNPRLNTYTLTVVTKPGVQPSSVERHIEELRRFIQRHSEEKGTPSQTPFLNTARECSDTHGGPAETVTEQPPPENLTQDPSVLNGQESEQLKASEETRQDSSAVVCERGRDPAQNPEASDSTLNNGNTEDRVCPCENNISTEREEEVEVGTAATVTVAASGNPAYKSDSEQGQADTESLSVSGLPCGKLQEETDTAPAAISTGQESPGKADNDKQEGEQAGQSATEDQTADKTGRVEGRDSADGDMGQTQSQDHKDTSVTAEVSTGPLKGEMLVEPKGPDNCADVRDVIVVFGEKESEAVIKESLKELAGAQEGTCSCVVVSSPGDGEGEGECKSETHCAGLKEETAGLDYSKENDSAASEVNNNETPVSERDTNSCNLFVNPETELGSPSQAHSMSRDSAGSSASHTSVLPEVKCPKECDSQGLDDRGTGGCSSLEFGPEINEQVSLKEKDLPSDTADTRDSPLEVGLSDQTDGLGQRLTVISEEPQPAPIEAASSLFQDVEVALEAGSEECSSQTVGEVPDGKQKAECMLPGVEEVVLPHIGCSVVESLPLLGQEPMDNMLPLKEEDRNGELTPPSSETTDHESDPGIVTVSISSTDIEQGVPCDCAVNERGSDLYAGDRCEGMPTWKDGEPESAAGSCECSTLMQSQQPPPAESEGVSDCRELHKQQSTQEVLLTSEGQESEGPELEQSGTEAPAPSPSISNRVLVEGERSTLPEGGPGERAAALKDIPREQPDGPEHNWEAESLQEATSETCEATLATSSAVQEGEGLEVSEPDEAAAAVVESDGSGAVGSDKAPSIESDGSGAMGSDKAPPFESDGSGAVGSDKAPSIESDGSGAVGSDKASSIESDGSRAVGSDKAAPFESDGSGAVGSDKAAPFESDGSGAVGSDKAAPFESDGSGAVGSDKAPPFESDGSGAVGSDKAPSIESDGSRAVGSDKAPSSDQGIGEPLPYEPEAREAGELTDGHLSCDETPVASCTHIDKEPAGGASVELGQTADIIMSDKGAALEPTVSKQGPENKDSAPNSCNPALAQESTSSVGRVSDPAGLSGSAGDVSVETGGKDACELTEPSLDRESEEAAVHHRGDGSPLALIARAAGQVDFSTAEEEEGTGDRTMIHREKENLYPIDSCTAPGLLEEKQSSESAECCQSSQDQLSVDSTVSPGASPVRRELGSDVDVFDGTDAGDDPVLSKQGGEILPGDSTSEVSLSCSSTDEPLPPGPPTSTPERRCESEEEEEDRLTEVPVRSSVLRTSIRSLSPFRRHSWGPGKNAGAESEMNQRSMRVGGDVVKKSPIHRRSMSWCPSDAPFIPVSDDISHRSYSLEGLAADSEPGKSSPKLGRVPRSAPLVESEERGSLVSLTEEEQESDLGDSSSFDSQKSDRRPPLVCSYSASHPLTKSVSLLTINQSGLDTQGRTRPKRRISFSFNISPLLPKSKTVFSIGSSSSDEEEPGSSRGSSSTSSSLAHSICEEDLPPSPLRKDLDSKSGTKVSRTLSFLKNKMYNSKKSREKDKEKTKEKDCKEKDKDKKALNGHMFSIAASGPSAQCYQCSKAVNAKEAYLCASCSACVHKGCRDSLPACAKVKMKQQKHQFAVPDSISFQPVTMRTRSTLPKERPRSAVLMHDDNSTSLSFSRRHTGIAAFNTSNLAKSISISNIAVPMFDEVPLRGLRYLSQSTDSLHKPNKVNESTESLTDEGTEMMDSQLMGEFEADVRELEADSWSLTVDKKLAKQLKKDMIKRQDVIYELMQTEMHHVRTLKIMADVYSKGLLKELQMEAQTVERIFPVLDDLLDLHTQLFSSLLERKKESRQELGAEGREGGFVIRRIGDILVSQFSGSSAERMKKVYGKFCGRHNEAVNYYKELHAKEKRFQAFIRKKMSSTIVRRLGIPECILLVTQRITKYPVLLQRILQHTKESEEDHRALTQALALVKEVISAVDSKVNEYEKKRKLNEIYSRCDSKSIMRMKSGQMFAREDLKRRKLLHDGPLQLKNAAGRLKDVQALLLSDVFVFLQEKDQKFVFASLDQRSTVISLQKLILREVANEEKGLFLITAGIEKPEMVEVYCSSKEERNTWMQLIQGTMQSMEKDDDEGIPSESEEDKRVLETKAREMREQLQQKDQQIVALLEEKGKLFREMCDCGGPDEGSPSTLTRTLFRASPEDMAKGEPIMKDALKEVETLQTLVNGSLGGAVGQQVSSSVEAECIVGPVSLPRRAETFGGFDSHQMNVSKGGEKDEGEESPDLRRTESDSVLKKQILHSVKQLHELLRTLQAVVVQQDTFIEDQRLALSERSASRPSSRPNSLIEQEKQRSLEKQRQELANLQRQQAAHAEEHRRQDREREVLERELEQREAQLSQREEETQRGRGEVEREREELRCRKEEYQKDLERLLIGQRQLDREREQIRRELERIEQSKNEETGQHKSPFSASEDSRKFHSTSSLERVSLETELPLSPKKEQLGRMDSKQKGKNLNPFTFNQSHKSQGGDGQNQIPNCLLQLTKSKEKKEKKKKKGKGQPGQLADPQHPPVSEAPAEGEEIYFC